MMRYGLIMAGVLALGGVVAACSVPVDLGQSAYEDNCVSCHGPSGQGDGPLAAGLDKRPADLTTISRRNGGTFPVAQVMSTIDGYTRGQHGGAQTMPEFGDLLRGRTVLFDSGDGIATPTPEKLVALAEYLRAIQK